MDPTALVLSRLIDHSTQMEILTYFSPDGKKAIYNIILTEKSSNKQPIIVIGL